MDELNVSQLQALGCDHLDLVDEVVDNLLLHAVNALADDRVN